MTGSGPLTYAAAGVDTAAGDRAVELMKAAVARTHSDLVVGGLGGFAGLIDVSFLRDYRRPLLASSTDGVGTKVAIAQALDVHDTIGRDLVAMVVDDIVVTGARPLALTDYIACGAVVPERIADIVRGIADGCRDAGVALVGGETAEHPGLLAADEYDLAGAAVGVVEADRLLGPQRVRDGDVLVAMASSGLHANGYSLVRATLAVRGIALTDHDDDLGRTVGEELLTPTAIYTADCLALLEETSGIHGLCHVTGGGLAANLARVIPAGLRATVERATWTPPPVFDRVAAWGDVPARDLEATLNMGVGMIAVVAPENADRVLATLSGRGVDAWHLGEVGRDDADRPREDTGPRKDAGDRDYRVQGTKGVDGGAVVMTGRHPS